MSRVHSARMRQGPGRSLDRPFPRALDPPSCVAIPVRHRAPWRRKRPPQQNQRAHRGVLGEGLAAVGLRVVLCQRPVVELVEKGLAGRGHARRVQAGQHEHLHVRRVRVPELGHDLQRLRGAAGAAGDEGLVVLEPDAVEEPPAGLIIREANASEVGRRAELFQRGRFLEPSSQGEEWGPPRGALTSRGKVHEKSGPGSPNTIPSTQPAHETR